MLIVLFFAATSAEATRKPTVSPTMPPTAMPIIPAYEVNNGASSGANSFPAALAYVDGQGGVPNITFGPGAYGRTCMLGDRIYFSNSIIIDLAGLTPPSQFSINGAGGPGGIQTVGANNSLSFAGNGKLQFVNGSWFASGGSSRLMATVETGTTLSLSENSYFFEAYGFMTADVYGTLMLSTNGHFSNTITTVYSGGLLSMDTGAYFNAYGVVIDDGGIFSSGVGGAYFYGSSLTFSSGATHQAEIGTGSDPVQMLRWSNVPAPAILGGTTLNVVSSQSLSSLLGNNYTIWTASGGSSSIFGQYGTQQFNGSSVNLPYTVVYAPSPTSITDVKVFFPFPTKAPSRVPSKAPSKEPSLLPTNSPSKSPSNIPSSIPSSSPIQEPSSAPSGFPSKVPSIRPSTIPTNVPSTQPTTMRVLPSCIRNASTNENTISSISIGGNPKELSRVILRGGSCFKMRARNTRLRVGNGGVLQLSNNSTFVAYGSGNTTIYGNVTVADKSYFGYFGSSPGNVFVYPEGIIFLMDEGTLHRAGVTIGGTFSSSGGYLEGGSITFLPNATHQAVMGQSTQLIPYQGIPSNGNLDGTLNVVGNTSDLTGTEETLWSTSGGSYLSGRYKQVLINGKSANGTCTVVYAPSSSEATRVSLDCSPSSRRLLSFENTAIDENEIKESAQQTHDDKAQQHHRPKRQFVASNNGGQALVTSDALFQETSSQEKGHRLLGFTEDAQDLLQATDKQLATSDASPRVSSWWLNGKRWFGERLKDAGSTGSQLLKWWGNGMVEFISPSNPEAEMLEKVLASSTVELLDGKFLLSPAKNCTSLNTAIFENALGNVSALPALSHTSRPQGGLLSSTFEPQGQGGTNRLNMSLNTSLEGVLLEMVFNEAVSRLGHAVVPKVMDAALDGLSTLWNKGVRSCLSRRSLQPMEEQL